ncbi:MAG TPA: TRCF domain-containing protein, partial [Gammaproteobacteria bacterium]|nr:TRCF domain-containing protein [Gammaproteobacteria bacterium]
IMDRADKLGLAQLHQLRGRVGRSHHQAYAYCFTPPQNLITQDAIKRLEALEALEELGAGFTLATHDLEIRGCGELLGEEQSGNLQAIGFNLYMELLERAVKALKQGKTQVEFSPLHTESEIDLKVPTLIPEHYLPDVKTRLVLYKRIASAKTKSELGDLQVEMIDRFGLLPDFTKNLFEVTKLKILAKPLGIKKVELGPSGGKIEFEDKPNIDPQKIIDLIHQEPHHYKLVGNNKLRLTRDLGSVNARIQELEKLIALLS